MMLVSADAGPALRADVDAGLRPYPEFLRLEQRYGVRLLDWSPLRGNRGRRCATQSLLQTGAALAALHHVDTLLSDGEHVGIPLAVSLGALGNRRPRHVMIGHHLLTPAKISAFRWLRPGRGLDTIVVHSANQVELLSDTLRIPADLMSVVPYGVDTEFWQPPAALEQTPAGGKDGLVVSAGREHRDYRCLADAGIEGPVFIADTSAYSPNAVCTKPDVWPPNVTRLGLTPVQLRRMYVRASVVVVPLMPTHFPFGITTILEAMSMGKAVVVTETPGLAGVIEDGRTGVIVRPGEAETLGAAVRGLLEDEGERQRLGDAARASAVRSYGLDRFTRRLARELGLPGSVAGDDAGHDW